MSKQIMVDNQPIKYQIWDTAGQEKYHSLAPMYYRGAAAAIIVYDITSAQSFQTLKNWVRELQQLGPENIVIAVCGNKSDLEEKRVSAICDDLTRHRVRLVLVLRSSRVCTQLIPPLARRLSAQQRPRATLTRSAPCFAKHPPS